MNISMELENTSFTTKQLPELSLPQIAIAGRSNVGKSSLLNALAGRKNLAKSSATPGKTRSVNFYLVSPFNFYLVDLPGYGYARASHEERKSWAKVLETYLARSEKLKGLALLVDCRLPPQFLDVELAEFAEANTLPVLPILAKADKCNQRERKSRQDEWEGILHCKPLLCSAKRRTGLDKVWKALIFMATGEKPEIGEKNSAEK